MSILIFSRSSSHLSRQCLYLPCVARRRLETSRRYLATHQTIRTKETSLQNINNIEINKERLLADLHHTCQWGIGERWGDQPTEVGMRRLALSDDDRHVRDWFVETTKSLGCTVTIDEMGNIFAIRPGAKPGPPTAAGSHLDTQPTGGRYDGILGVISAVEMLKTLNQYGVETEYPIGVVNWTK
jgi:hypothetical protein